MKKENKKTKLNISPDMDEVYPLVSLRTEPYEFQYTNPICRWNKKTKSYEPYKPKDITDSLFILNFHSK